MNSDNINNELGKEEVVEDLYANVHPDLKHYFIERDNIRNKIRSLKYNPYRVKKEKRKLIFFTIVTFGVFSPLLIMYICFDKKIRNEYEENKEKLRQLGEEYKDEYSKINSDYEGRYHNDITLSPGDLDQHYVSRSSDFDDDSYSDGDFGGWDDGGYDGSDDGGYDGGGYDGGGDGGDGD